VEPVGLGGKGDPVERGTLLAERMSRLGTESAFEVLARARALEAQGRSVIHLEIGEPDFDTPEHIVTAAIEALRSGDTHYTPSAGLPELRAAIAEEVSRTRGIPVDPDQVVVTPGGKPIMFFTILALAEEGVEVIYPDPGFPIYESVIRFAGATPVPLPLREEFGFAFDPDELRRLVTRRTRLVIVNSPLNPTGAVVGREALEELARLAQEYGFVVLSDEIYRRIVYGVEVPSIASLPGMAERTVILDGFSKTYAMTGWRLGYGVAPRWLAEHLVRLAVNCHSCVPGFTQRAGLPAAPGGPARGAGATGTGGTDGRRVPAPPGRGGRWTQQPARRAVPGTGWSVLRFPERARDRPLGRGVGSGPAGRSRRRRAGRYGVRPVRGWLPTVVVRELAGQSARGDRADAPVSRRLTARSNVGVERGTVQSSLVSRA